MQLSLRQLRDRCKKHGLKVRGSKYDLAARLVEQANSGSASARRPSLNPEPTPRPVFDVYGADRKTRKRTQREFYQPAVTRPELLDDDTSDSRGIECDDDYAADSQESEESESEEPRASDCSDFPSDFDESTSSESEESAHESSSSTSPARPAHGGASSRSPSAESATSRGGQT